MISRDYGFTWEIVLRGTYKSILVNGGSVIVAINIFLNQVLYIFNFSLILI